ncbi:MAG: outer membrane protein assembly factor BamE [Akkermansiaceae bacterium]|jgi:outer membrane protein assembly factor BamE (lipoprotein component of BamABCDE complex)|nr:outer membrane protein assembly factor BamE [Akkermansiaceae bacterium]
MKSLSMLLPFVLLASCASQVSPVAIPGTKPSSTEIKKGMTREDVGQVIGKPSYRYSLNQEEIWVFENKNPTTELAKSTALNMVPLAGPLISLAGEINPKPEEAKAEITFNKDGKVTAIEQAKADKD